MPPAGRCPSHRKASEDRAVACTALTAYFQRVYPERTPPGLLDEATVRQVARCAASIRGSRDKKLEALQDSIDGAFSASSRAPTTAFIWARPEHFFAHAERGRKARLAEERKKRAAAEGSAGASGAARAAAPAAQETAARVDPAQMSADIDQMFRSFKPRR